MATISITTPSDGQTIDASDVATPLNTIVTEINGNLDSNNIAEGGVVPNSLTDGTGTSWSWSSWTPTYTNITVGNGTVTAKYIQIGKTVHGRFRLDCGSTTSIAANFRVTLPVELESGYSNYEAIGSAIARDSSSANEIPGVVQVFNAGASADVEVRWADSEGSANDPGDVPFAEADGDRFTFSFTYEAA